MRNLGLHRVVHSEKQRSSSSSSDNLNNATNDHNSNNRPTSHRHHQGGGGRTPYSGIIERYISDPTNNDGSNHNYIEHRRLHRNPMFGTSNLPVEDYHQQHHVPHHGSNSNNVHQHHMQQQKKGHGGGGGGGGGGMLVHQQHAPSRQAHPAHDDNAPYNNRRASFDVEGHTTSNSTSSSVISEITTTSTSTTFTLYVTMLPTILQKLWIKYKDTVLFVILLVLFCIKVIGRRHHHVGRVLHRTLSWNDNSHNSDSSSSNEKRPNFVYTHPYVTSSYYTSTSNIDVLNEMKIKQVFSKQHRGSDEERGITNRLAIVRPFCEFDAQALPTTFACWNSLVPCRAAEMDLGDTDGDEEDEDEWVLFDISLNGNGRKLHQEEEDDWDCEEDSVYHNPDYDNEGILEHIQEYTTSLFKRCKKKQHSKKKKKGPTDGREYFDDVPADALRTMSVDLFLFYSQTFSENDVAITAVDKIMEEFYSVGGWSRCFDNIYAVEANIPKELDLYIPAAQEELYNWVNGPNRQYEAGFRIIQSGEWGKYDGFYLMEGDSVPVKNYWLDVILGEVNYNKPFAVLGAQYDGDKWDSFYEDIPISLLHHTNGNAIYNTSHPLLERMTGQLEVEAPCPYNSIPYDYRMSQMWVEGTIGIVPKLAPKIMLNDEGQNITLSDNIKMFTKWANQWKDEEPYKFTKAIHNYASTNLIPRHLGPEYVIHGAKLYSPWDPARTKITLVISEWFFDRSLNLIKKLDQKDHPFSNVIIMVPPSVSNEHDYTEYTSVPVKIQFRGEPDFMDLCTANVETEWFMITNSYHQVSRHVDLMFTPGKFLPVVPFTPATYSFCLKYPYCKEIIMLAQRWNQRHSQVVLDMDMLYHTQERSDFCKEWTDRNGENGEHLYAKHQPLRWKLRNETIIGPKGPTGTDYLAYLTRENKGGMYKMTDRSLYGARAPFVKVYRKEEKFDGMSEDELARRLGMTFLSNTTECTCDRFETDEECSGSGLGCEWRPLFESCHPPEMIDDGMPICETTEAPTLSPTISIERMLAQTDAPTIDGDWKHWHWWIAPPEDSLEL